MVGDWRDDLEAWLEPFVAALRHKTRGRMCPSYVAGLIGPGDRKSVQPMAARSGGELRPVAPFRVERRLGCGPIGDSFTDRSGRANRQGRCLVDHR